MSLYVNALSISKSLESHFLGQNLLSYRIQQFFHRKYTIPNGYTNNVEFSTLLTSFSYLCSSMLIWLRPTSLSTKTDVLKNHPINAIKLTNGNSQSLNNNIVPTTAWLKQLCNTFFFPYSSFFNDTNNNCYLMTWSTDPEADIYMNEYHGAIPIKDNYMLWITPGSTQNVSMELHVIFYSPAIYEINREGSIGIINSGV